MINGKSSDDITGEMRWS